jgi:hypothetical protein
VGAFGVLGRAAPDAADRVFGRGVDGHLLVAVAAFSTTATTAALYYMVHSTFAAACLFLIADLVVTRRATDTLRTRPPTVQNGLFAALFFAAAIAMAGMPPLSGFPRQAPGPRRAARARRDRLGLDRDPGRVASDHRRVCARGQCPVLEIHGTACRSLRLRQLPMRRSLPRSRLRRRQVAPVMLPSPCWGCWQSLPVPCPPISTTLAAQLFDRAAYVDAVLAPSRRTLSHADPSDPAPAPEPDADPGLAWAGEHVHARQPDPWHGLRAVIPMLTAAYWPDRPTIARPLKVAEYMLIVLWDIVVANVQVAMIILFKREPTIRSQWIPSRWN